MGFYNSPRIVTDNLVFLVDAGNVKSYAGDIVTPVGTDYGYFGGGNFDTGGSSASVIQRIDFNNDTATSVAKGTESISRQNRGGSSSVTHGYLAGGTILLMCQQ